MKTIEEIAGTLVLTAPGQGRLSLHAPRELCGELEVYAAGEPVFTVDLATVTAPRRCFVARTLRRPGDLVADGEPVLELGIPT